MRILTASILWVPSRLSWGRFMETYASSCLSFVLEGGVDVGLRLTFQHLSLPKGLCSSISYNRKGLCPHVHHEPSERGCHVPHATVGSRAGDTHSEQSVAGRDTRVDGEDRRVIVLRRVGFQYIFTPFILLLTRSMAQAHSSPQHGVSGTRRRRENHGNGFSSDANGDMRRRFVL